MSLIERLKKNSTLKETDILGSSKFFSDKEFITTSVPAINIALQGCLDGGFSAGLTQFVGPSKHFKTGFTLLLMKSYLDKYKDSMAIFYDSEFGTPQSYFSAYGIDMTRVLHCPIANLEDLKFDIMQQLEEIKRGDKVFIAVDSIGNLASKKEVEDAKEQKSVADMSRAKQMKSLFRMITPVLTLKQIPMVVVNHSYMTQELYSKTVVAGGCLVEGTKILLADGTYSEVQDIKPGQFVKTLLGNKEVTHSWTPDTLEDGTPNCIEVEFEDGYKVICSENHKFLVNDTWVEANKLTLDMNISVV